MISLTIISETSEQSNEIIRLLLKKRLVIEGIIEKNTRSFRLDNKNNIIETDSTRLICTTKSLLFTEIDELLREKYKHNLPILYSVPIANMDWEQSKTLIVKTQMV